MTIRYVRWVATTGRYRELKNMRGTYKIMIASALLFAVLSLTVAVAQTADDAEGADPVFVIIDNVKYKISGSEAEAVKCTNPYLETTSRFCRPSTTPAWITLSKRLGRVPSKNRAPYR